MKELGGGQMKMMRWRRIGQLRPFSTARKCADVRASSLPNSANSRPNGDGQCPPPTRRLELQKRLKTLEDELNRHLAGEYGVKVGDKVAYAKWVKSHQPFHWFIQFYGILNRGGFDVIIGNPPYVEYRESSKGVFV